jgi:uncharacterized protein (UPF0305 family)
MTLSNNSIYTLSRHIINQINQLRYHSVDPVKDQLNNLVHIYVLYQIRTQVSNQVSDHVGNVVRIQVRYKLSNNLRK